MLIYSDLLPCYFTLEKKHSLLLSHIFFPNYLYLCLILRFTVSVLDCSLNLTSFLLSSFLLKCGFQKTIVISLSHPHSVHFFTLCPAAISCMQLE